MSQRRDNRPEPDTRREDAAETDDRSSRGWRPTLLSLKDAVAEDRLSLIAAGVAFFVFLAIFPALTALLSIYGLVSDPAQVAQHISSLQGTLPPSTLELLQKQMSSITQGSGSSLGFALVASILVALYSASKGMGAMLSALNIAFNQSENRGFIKLKAFTLLYTLVAICFAIIMLGVIGLSMYLQTLGLPHWLDMAIQIVSWLIRLALMIAAVIALYALTPNRPRPPLRQVIPGATLATISWLIVSLGFSFYITHFNSYNKAYGSLAAIVVLLLWLWISAFVVLLGAEVNAVLYGRSGDGDALSSGTSAPDQAA